MSASWNWTCGGAWGWWWQCLHHEKRRLHTTAFPTHSFPKTKHPLLWVVTFEVSNLMWRGDVRKNLKAVKGFWVYNDQKWLENQMCRTLVCFCLCSLCHSIVTSLVLRPWTCKCVLPHTWPVISQLRPDNTYVFKWSGFVVIFWWTRRFLLW